jgi:hypothetical protein
MLALVMAAAALAGLGACGNSQEPGIEATDAKARAAATTPGVPAGGPDVLYAPPPDVPQLQNRDPRFRAPFEMVSGTERYVDGEYLYTDFIYDDEAAYPADFARYAGNAADLVEFRIAAPGNGPLAVRFTLNTLLFEDTTIAVVAFDSDRDASTGSSTLPRDPGMPFPGTDQVLTTWGTAAEWSKWNGSSWDTVSLDARTDLEANQITVVVPKAVADPSGQWLATLAVGLFDPAAGGWLALAAPSPVATPVAIPAAAVTPKIINLGFRFNEVEQALPPRESGGAAPYDKQAAALSAAEPTRFANLLDFDLLRSRGKRDNVPAHGMLYRMFASRLPWVILALDDVPGVHGETRFTEGKNREFDIHYMSPLQPYAVYIPSTYDPAVPAPMTFALHGWGGEYFWLNESGNHLARFVGEDRKSIVLSPAARGTGGFYADDLQYDLLEAWNDVAHHYTLDPQRTAVTGVSMGGHGTYRLALLYPHLFARALPIIPAISRGIWFPGVTASGGDRTLTNRWIENARNLPIFHIGDMASELTFYPGQAQQAIGPAVNGMQSLESNGYRYKFRSVAIDHFLIGTNHPEVSEFLGQHVIEPEPFHVTYARMPSNDSRGLVHNRAYWLSGIELRDPDATQPRGLGDEAECATAATPCAPLAKGVIDAVSLGFGKSDPASSQSVIPGVTAGGWAYVETERKWDEPGSVAVENRILIKATNIAKVTIDPVAARVDCNVALDIESDDPADPPEVTLAGCP